MATARPAAPGSRLFAAGPWIGLAALTVVPFFGSGYITRFLTELFMLIAIAQAWNIIGGLSGYVSFGIVVFFGLGAYATGLLVNTTGLPFLVAVLVGMAVTVAFAVLIGRPILRLRGHYFAIATFGIAEGIRQVANTATPLTGGGMGLNLPLISFGSGSIQERSAFFYYLILGVLVLSVATTWTVLHRRLGFGLRAIRADEDAAATLGVNCARYKTIAFALSAAFPALAGGIYAGWQTYIDPVTVFSVDLSVNAVLVTLVGGIGTLWGPTVGGVLVLVIGEAIWGSFLELHSAFLGVVLMLGVIFLPRGVLGTLRGRHWRRADGQWVFRPAAIRQTLRRYSV